MTMQGWGAKTIAGLGVFAGWFLACAGDDIPPIEDELRGAIAAEFGGGPQMGSGGTGSGSAGRGGSGSSGSGNAGSANNADSGNAGAAGDGGEPVGGGGGEFCDAFPILARSCGIVGNCHNEGAGQGAFAVDEQGVVEFVDKPSTKGNACDQVFIDSSNPEDSLIYTRLFGTDCGGLLSMPLTGDPLTEEESDCVLSWLQQFAE